jgi:hypothetical protein
VPNAPATPTRTFRISDEIWLAAKAKAKVEKRTLTDVVVSALLAFVEDDTPES